MNCNKKLKFKLLIIFILVANTFSAQEKTEKPINSIITISLISPTLSYVPRLNLGYIKKINERYWAGVELGYGTNNLLSIYHENYTSIGSDYKVFEIRPEVYYDLRPNSKLKHLISAELFYINHTDYFNRGWFDDVAKNIYYRHDGADYKREKYGFNLNYNLILNISKNIALMQKLGVGFRQRVVKFSNVINQRPDLNYEESDVTLLPNTNGYANDVGTANAFNFNFDLKIICKF
jgi:hypothetical protein